MPHIMFAGIRFSGDAGLSSWPARLRWKTVFFLYARMKAF